MNINYLPVLGNFVCFFVVCLFFSKSTFLKYSFRNTIKVSNSLDPDQARHLGGHGLGPNCLQMLSADDTSRQSFNSCHAEYFYVLHSSPILIMLTCSIAINCKNDCIFNQSGKLCRS